MATGVRVGPQPFPVGATPQVSVSRSASPAQWVNHGREIHRIEQILLVVVQTYM